MEKLLLPTKSLCKDERQKIIVSEENRLKHTAKNINACRVRHYKIDGDIISSNDQLKCDYLLINDDKQDAYFIELKGKTDVKESMRQIQATINLLKGELSGYIYYGRMVGGRRLHAMATSELIKCQNEFHKYKGNFKTGTNHMEENI